MRNYKTYLGQFNTDNAVQKAVNDNELNKPYIAIYGSNNLYNVDYNLKNERALYQCYIQNNLIAQFDGEYNTSLGHNNTADTWYDLTGNGYDLIHTGQLESNKFYWENNGFVVQKGNYVPLMWYSTQKYPTVGNDYLYWTIELVAEITGDTGEDYNIIWSTLKLDTDFTSQYDNSSFGYDMGKAEQNNSSNPKWGFGGNKHYQSINGEGTTVFNPNSNLIYIARYLEFPYVTNTDNIKVFIYSTIDDLTVREFTTNNFSQYTSGSFAPNEARIALFGNKGNYDNILNNQIIENNSKIKIYACRYYNRQLTSEEILQNAQLDTLRFNF